MSSNVFKLGNGLVLVWVMTWCCWRQALDQPLMTHPDSKIHGANMGPTWVLSAPDGPHVGPTNLAIRHIMLPCDVTRQWVDYELTMTFICFKSFLPGSIVQILGDIVLEYCFIKLYMIFSISMEMFIYYFSKGGFHPTHHVFKWTNASHSSKLATSFNCTFAQMYSFWPLPGPRYFSHMVRCLLVCVDLSDYNCHVCV